MEDLRSAVAKQRKFLYLIDLDNDLNVHLNNKSINSEKLKSRGLGYLRDYQELNFLETSFSRSGGLCF